MSIKLNRILTDLETGFNVADSLPVVGVVSSPLRFAAGKVQLLAGASFALIGLVGCLCDKDNKDAWKKVVHLGSQHMNHGALNMIRAVGTFLLASAGLNIGLLVWQLIRDKGFAPVFAYDVPVTQQARKVMAQA